jgi:hypothetical protein
MSSFDPHLTTNIAIYSTLFAAFLWGSWAVLIKHLKGYPVDGFFLTIFVFSLIFVWGVGFVVDRANLIWDIKAVYSADPLRLWVTLICGALYVGGLRLTLLVYGRIGLTLAQPIQLSINIVFATLFSAAFGGVIQELVIARITLATFILLSAVAISLLAGKQRMDHQNSDDFKSKLRFNMKDLWICVGIMIAAAAISPIYSFAISYGVHSTARPGGFGVLPFMALLSSGAFVGALLISGIVLSKNKRWREVFDAPLLPHLSGMVAGLCHFGGNIINIIATASLSSIIAWPLSATYGLWGLFWGLVHGEFRGSGRRSYFLLFFAMLLYFVGAFLIANQV